jgi:hypothetical protein
VRLKITRSWGAFGAGMTILESLPALHRIHPRGGFATSRLLVFGAAAVVSGVLFVLLDRPEGGENGFGVLLSFALAG